MLHDVLSVIRTGQQSHSWIILIQIRSLPCLWAWGIDLCCLPFAEGLNADYVKGENLEAVVCEEPQGKLFLVRVPC